VQPSILQRQSASNIPRPQQAQPSQGSPLHQGQAWNTNKEQTQAREELGETFFDIIKTLKHTKVSVNLMDLLEYEEPCEQVINHLKSKRTQKKEWRKVS